MPQLKCDIAIDCRVTRGHGKGQINVPASVDAEFVRAIQQYWYPIIIECFNRPPARNGHDFDKEVRSIVSNILNPQIGRVAYVGNSEECGKRRERKIQRPTPVCALYCKMLERCSIVDMSAVVFAGEGTGRCCQTAAPSLSD